jgi:hypothetical protein
MFNVFEQPWTLLAAALLVLFGVFTFRSVWPEKQKRWQWLLPLIVAGLAFGLDAIVATDLEKIHAVTNTAIQAVEHEDCPGVASCIAPDYRDSRHISKADLMQHCREQMAGPTVAKIRKISSDVDLSRTPARVTLVLSIVLEKQSRIVQQHGVLSCMVKVQLLLRKQPDKRWLISDVEVLEVDHMPVSWSNV